MPFDHLARNDYSGAPHIGTGICGGELRDVSHDAGLDGSSIQPQRHWVCPNRRAHVSNADGLRRLPCGRQLHAEFDGLLRLSPGGLQQHGWDGRKRSQSRRVRVPDHRIGLCHVPPDYHLGGGIV